MESIRQQWRKADENTVTCWGYRFQLTPDHLTPEQSHPLKFSYDKLGEECLDRLNKISPPSNTPTRQSSQRKDEGNGVANGKDPSDLPKPPKRDLYVLLKENYMKDDVLRKFWDEVNTVPQWVDWEQVS